MEKINDYPGPYHWYQSRFQFAKYRRQFELAKPFLASDARVLDFGCGDGRMTSLLAPHVKEVYGVDSQKRALQFAHLMNKEKNVYFKKNILTKIPFQNCFFNTALSFDVIEHLPQEQVPSFLIEMYRVLQPGGYFIMSTPNRESLSNRLFGHVLDEKHYYEYTMKELSLLFTKHNFKICAISGIYLQPVFRLDRAGDIAPFFPFFKILIHLGKNYPALAEKLFFICKKE